MHLFFRCDCISLQLSAAGFHQVSSVTLSSCLLWKYTTWLKIIQHMQRDRALEPGKSEKGDKATRKWKRITCSGCKRPNSHPVYAFNGVCLFLPFQTNARIMWEVSPILGESPKPGRDSLQFVALSSKSNTQCVVKATYRAIDEGDFFSIGKMLVSQQLGIFVQTPLRQKHVREESNCWAAASTQHCCNDEGALAGYERPQGSITACSSAKTMTSSLLQCNILPSEDGRSTRNTRLQMSLEKCSRTSLCWRCHHCPKFHGMKHCLFPSVPLPPESCIFSTFLWPSETPTGEMGNTSAPEQPLNPSTGHSSESVIGLKSLKGSGKASAATAL